MASPSERGSTARIGRRGAAARGFVVILAGARDGANVGAAARAMKNCGIGELRLVGGRRIGARARRTAVRSEEVLAAARRFATLEDAAADAAWVVGFTARARRFGPGLESWDLDAAAALRERGKRGKVALVFGREDAGLTGAEVRHCAALYRLPASPARPVYNLAQAVLLVCHAIAFGGGAARRGARALPAESAAGAGAAEGAPKQQIDSLMAEFARALGALKYPPPARPHDRTARILARIESQFSRAGLAAEDVALWRGILARIRG